MFGRWRPLQPSYLALKSSLKWQSKQNVRLLMGLLEQNVFLRNVQVNFEHQPKEDLTKTKPFASGFQFLLSPSPSSPRITQSNLCKDLQWGTSPRLRLSFAWDAKKSLPIPKYIFHHLFLIFYAKQLQEIYFIGVFSAPSILP